MKLAGIKSMRDSSTLDYHVYSLNCVFLRIIRVLPLKFLNSVRDALITLATTL